MFGVFWREGLFEYIAGGRLLGSTHPNLTLEEASLQIYDFISSLDADFRIMTLIDKAHILDIERSRLVAIAINSSK